MKLGQKFQKFLPKTCKNEAHQNVIMVGEKNEGNIETGNNI